MLKRKKQSQKLCIFLVSTKMLWLALKRKSVD
jgi:hypothetical protein